MSNDAIISDADHRETKHIISGGASMLRLPKINFTQLAGKCSCAADLHAVDLLTKQCDIYDISICIISFVSGSEIT